MFTDDRLAKIAAAMTQRETSRRSFLTTTAKFGGGALALALAASPLSAFAEGNRPGPGKPHPGPQPQPNPQPNDLDVLNYALTLEHFEAAFYNAGVAEFSESDIADYLSGMNFGSAVADDGYQRLSEVRSHENQHVQTLMSVISSLGGTPVPPCNYDFSGPLTSPADFLATAMLLENTGVMAYDGAIALIQSRQIQTAGATIATVEARHASYFNLLNGADPFPSAFDRATAPQAIVNAVLATGLIVSCPVAPPIPDQPQGCTP